MYRRNYKIDFLDLNAGVEQKLPTSYQTVNGKGINISFDYIVGQGLSNQFNLTLFNLGPDTQALFHGNNTIRLIEFFVSYSNGELKSLFKGQVLKTFAYRSGTDLLYNVVCIDFLGNIVSNLFKNTYDTGTSSLKILNDALSFFAPNVSVGNADLLKKTYVTPISYISNSLQNIIGSLAKDNGVMPFYERQTVNFLPKFNSNLNLGNADNPILISKENGLVGNVRQESLSQDFFPIDYITQTDMSLNYPVVSVTTLMKPYKIGQYVKLNCEIKNLNSYTYLIYSIRYAGEFSGVSWVAQLSLRPIQ